MDLSMRSRSDILAVAQHTIMKVRAGTCVVATRTNIARDQLDQLDEASRWVDIITLFVLPWHPPS
jgi:hypothetical protein